VQAGDDARDARDAGGEGAGQSDASTGVLNPEGYVAGGGCRCDLPGGSGSGWALIVALAAVASARRRGRGSPRGR
jgi:hypothetical protein